MLGVRLAPPVLILALTACGSVSGPPVPPSAAATPAAAATHDVDAATPVRPECSGEGRGLAAGFTLTQPVDYVATRWSGCKDTNGCPVDVLSSAGEPCATASDVPACRKALARPGHFAHLATTQGDTVRTWNDEQMLELLGPIDTIAEAIWLVRSKGFGDPCDVTIREEADGVYVDGLHLVLADTSFTIGLRVSEDGAVETVSSSPPLDEAPIACLAIGCADYMKFASDVEGSFEGLRASSLEACVNGICWSFPLAMLSGVPTTTTDATGLMQIDEMTVYATVGTQDDVQLWLLVTLQHEGNPRIAIGDAFEIRVRDAQAKEILAMQQTVTELPEPAPQGRCSAARCTHLEQDTRAVRDPWSL
jgi:hypothetical protein